jgi:hypothetical protein
MCGSLELYNSSKKMTRQGRYVQQGLVPSSIANSRSPPMSQLHTNTHTLVNSGFACWVFFRMVESLYGVLVKDGSTRREIKPPCLQNEKRS